MRFLIIVILACFLPAWAQLKTLTPSSQVKIGQTIVHVTLSTTPIEKTHGLQGIKNLDTHEGMLFIYHDPQILKYWMRDMYIPLDIIWIGHDQKILKISDSVPPCGVHPCPIYSSEKPAQYVLEVNAGFSKAHHITAGMPVIIL